MKCRQILKKIEPYINNTKLIHYKDNIYIKKESNQITNSFKWSGVLYSVMCEFEKLKNIILHEKYYIVTQSTGNHAIALINSVNKCKNIYSKYVDINNIYVYIFGNENIIEEKWHALKSLQSDKVIIDKNYKNYETSLKAREIFLKTNDGVYLKHGGKNILHGYSALGLLINKQIEEIDNKIKSVGFYAAVGAGGPIGIGKGISLNKELKMVSCQTTEFNAFNRSIRLKKMCKNDMEQPVNVSNGIAVNEPEKYAFELGKKIVYKTVDVDTKDVEILKKNNSYGDSTCISLCSLNKYKTDTDIIIILDCEKVMSRSSL